jgi:ribokinase
MFGCVGDDENGRKMLDNFRANGVNTDYVKTVQGIPTGIAIITVGESDNTIIVVAGANGAVDRAYVDSVKDELLQYDMVVLQHEIPLDTVHYIVELCYESHVPVVLNPAPAAEVPADIIDKVTWLTPNEHEAALIFGTDRTAEELLAAYPEKLVITQGSRGVSAGLASGGILNVPVRAAKVADTTGAGDTLNGAFCVRIAMGDSMEDALRYANTAASLSTEKFGAQGGMPTAEEVEHTLEMEGLR